MAGQFFDDLETRDPQQREVSLLEGLSTQIANAQSRSSAFGKILKGIDSADITSREALAKLPVTRKAELIDLQKKAPPFGGLTATAVRDLGRVFASPGPIFEPEAKRNDYWRISRALFAAGIRRGDLIHNAFAYHMTPAGFMMESGAHALGCPVFPAGPTQVEEQVQAISHLLPVAYCGIPAFLKILMEKADELDIDISSMKRAMVSGAALPPSLRQELNAGGVNTMQCYATADIGLIAYETEPVEGMIIDEGIIVELVLPGTGDPVDEGEVGEIVVTTLNPDYPLIRFATGDLTAVLPGQSDCGRTGLRIKGWMGRADETTKVRGMFVHPLQVGAVTKQFPEISRARLIVNSVDHRDSMTLQCETEKASSGLAEKIETRIREICKVRGEVELVSPGTLADDGKVIDDLRTNE